MFVLNHCAYSILCWVDGLLAGEISELRNELGATDLDTMKDAVKKVIAAITVGKDMNPLFPDVVNCMRTGTGRIETRRPIALTSCRV